MANSVDSDQTAPEQSDLVYTVCICHFVRNLGAQTYKDNYRNKKENIRDWQKLILTLVKLNKLRCHAYLKFSANQITWSRLLI